MSIINITIRRLLEYNTTASIWLMKNKDNGNTKLGYSISRMIDRYNKAIKPHTEIIQKANDDMEDVRQDHQKEEGGKLIWDIVKDNGKEIRERAYSKEDAKKITKRVREIQDKMEKDLEALLNDPEKGTVEIEPRFATSIPEGLTDFEKEVFSGIVIDPAMLQEKEAAPLNGTKLEVTASA